MYYVPHPLYPLSVCGHLRRFYVSAIVNSTAVNVRVHVSLKKFFFGVLLIYSVVFQMCSKVNQLFIHI